MGIFTDFGFCCGTGARGPQRKSRLWRALLATTMRHGKYLITFLLVQRLFWVLAMGTFPDTIMVTLGVTVFIFELLPTLLLMFRDNTGAFVVQGGWKQTFWLLFTSGGAASLIYTIFLFPLAAHGYSCDSNKRVPILSEVVNCGDWGAEGIGEQQSRTMFLYFLIAILFHVAEMSLYSTGLRTSGTAWKMELSDTEWIRKNRDMINIGAIVTTLGVTLSIYLYDYNQVHIEGLHYIIATLGTIVGGITMAFAIAFVVYQSKKDNALQGTSGKTALLTLVGVSLVMTTFILFIMVVMWQHAASCEGWNVGMTVTEWGDYLYDIFPFLDQPCMEQTFQDYSHFWVPVFYYTIAGIFCLMLNVVVVMIFLNESRVRTLAERAKVIYNRRNNRNGPMMESSALMESSSASSNDIAVPSSDTVLYNGPRSTLPRDLLGYMQNGRFGPTDEELQQVPEGYFNRQADRTHSMELDAKWLPKPKSHFLNRRG